MSKGDVFHLCGSLPEFVKSQSLRGGLRFDGSKESYDASDSSERIGPSLADVGQRRTMEGRFAFSVDKRRGWSMA